ncbi:tyrosine-type recombinase/integrase [Bacteroidota bacterium]
MVKTRYKKLASGKYSIYLDIYAKDSDGNIKRSYDFLGIYVNADYSKVKRIKEEDKEKIRRAQVIKAKRELESIDVAHNLPRKKGHSKIDLYKVFEELQQKKYDDNVRCGIKHLKDFSQSIILYNDDVDINIVDDFWEYLLSIMHHNTAVTYLKRLQAYLNKAVQKNMLPENPMGKFKIPKSLETETIYLTFDEVQRLKDTTTNFNPMIRYAFFFGCFTGLRLGDVRSLKWNEIKNNQIVLRPEKTSNTSGKILYLDITQEAQKILDLMKKDYPDEYVFPDLPGKQTINKNLKIWAKTAKIDKNIHYHISRHTFGTMLVTFEVDIYSVKEMLGHKTIGIESNGRLEKTAIYYNGEQLGGIKEMFLNLDEEGAFDAIIQYEGSDKNLHTKQIFTDYFDNIKVVEPTFTEEESQELQLLTIESEGEVEETSVFLNDESLDGIISIMVHIKGTDQPSGLKAFFKSKDITDKPVFTAEITFRNEDDSEETETIF